MRVEIVFLGRCQLSQSCEELVMGCLFVWYPAATERVALLLYLTR